MSSILDGVDLTNPCLVWPVLQQVKYRRLANEQDIESEFDFTDGTRRKVKFQTVSIAELDAEIERLKADCDRLQGKRRRYPIRGVFRT